ncbi:MAG: DUF2318 domain-containing protein [Nitrospirota bacterium]|jgi:uncharacterized membrane protein
MSKKRKKQNIKQNDFQAHKKEEKREAVVSGSKSKGSSKSTFAGIAVALAAAALVGFIIFGGGGSNTFAPVSAQAGVVKLPVSEVNDGHAHFYTFKGARKDVNFFVLRSSDGVIRAAFDACDVCYREKKGYRQEGDLMVCNNCGQQFPSVKINVLKGGCNPAPLERQVEGDYLVLDASDIEGGAFYF